MITIYAKDLESAQKLANKHRIPAELWKFLCSEGEFKGREFEGVVLNELQSDKTVEFLLTRAIKTKDFPAVKAYREIVEKQAQRYFDMMKGN